MFGLNNTASGLSYSVYGQNASSTFLAAAVRGIETSVGQVGRRALGTGLRANRGKQDGGEGGAAQESSGLVHRRAILHGGAVAARRRPRNLRRACPGHPPVIIRFKHVA